MNEAEYTARLIDAGKLNFRCNYNGDCSGDISHCKECDNYVLEYRDIQEQPTVYDIDKVVEQLKDVSYERFGNAGMGRENVVNLDDAIEIIKAGSKNE